MLYLRKLKNTTVGVLIYFLVFYVLLAASLYMLFPKLGIEPWKGLVPGLNFMEIAEKVGRSRWYGLLFFVPIVAFFIVAGLAVALVRSFGKDSFKDAAIAVLYSPISFFQLAKDDNAKYNGPIIAQEKDYMQQIADAKAAGQTAKYKSLVSKNPYKKSVSREWGESLVFAVFAAAFIRMFLVEAYVIPTPSMEGSLLVGDYLFVSKSSYGIRTPQTIAMVPLLHNRVPFLNTESYLKKPSLPYYRLPAIRDIERGSPFVFNWPAGDTVYVTSQRSYTIGQARRAGNAIGDPELRKMHAEGDYIVRPVDKKDHYIKRCVGLPGDSLQIIAGQLYINGAAAENPEHMQFKYTVSGTSINEKKLNEWGIDRDDIWGRDRGVVGYVLDQDQVEKLRGVGARVDRVKLGPSPLELFPFDTHVKDLWSIDNYGPIWIPKKGATTPLTVDNLPFYKKIIADYEYNDIEVKGGKIYINGKESDSYTFKQDYYWGMGDNRHSSEDSRMWGYVPHDHIVGKPLFIWFSKKNGIRWDRMFTSASK